MNIEIKDINIKTASNKTLILLGQIVATEIDERREANIAIKKEIIRSKFKN